MRQDERAPFDRALHDARVSAYAPGEFVGQESFMTAGEIRGLALQAGVGPGAAVLDLCCGVAGPGRFITRELACAYLGVDASASAVAIARERAGGEPCRFLVAPVPPLPAGSFDVVLLLETMLAFADKDALVRAIAAALRPGGRFAFTLEEGSPLTSAERAAMPDADTVWLTPLDELAASLERAGLVLTWQQDHSRAHRATAHALAGAFAADGANIAAQLGRRALDELVAAHRLWVRWLDEGRVRKLALVAEREAGGPERTRSTTRCASRSGRSAASTRATCHPSCATPCSLPPAPGSRAHTRARVTRRRPAGLDRMRADSELYLRGMQTLVASWTAYARGAVGAAVVRSPGVAAAVFPHEPARSVYNNALLGHDLAPADRTGALDAMEAAYAAAAVTRFAAWVHESDAAMSADLRARGYTLDTATRAMGMALDEIRLPRPAIDLAPPDWSESLRVHELPAGLLDHVDARLFRAQIARLEGESVAAGMAFDHDGDAGIYNVGTRKRARRRGLGTAVTALLAHDAAARGCRTATLQATAMAERVYAAVGFRDLGRILEYVPAET